MTEKSMSKIGCSFIFILLILGGGMLLHSRLAQPVAHGSRCKPPSAAEDSKTISGENVRQLLLRLQLHRAFLETDKFGEDMAELVFWAQEYHSADKHTFTSKAQIIETINKQYQKECLVMPLWLTEVLKEFAPDNTKGAGG